MAIYRVHTTAGDLDTSGTIGLTVLSGADGTILRARRTTGITKSGGRAYAAIDVDDADLPVIFVFDDDTGKTSEGSIGPVSRVNIVQVGGRDAIATGEGAFDFASIGGLSSGGPPVLAVGVRRHYYIFDDATQGGDLRKSGDIENVHGGQSNGTFGFMFDGLSTADSLNPDDDGYTATLTFDPTYHDGFPEDGTGPFSLGYEIGYDVDGDWEVNRPGPDHPASNPRVISGTRAYGTAIPEGPVSIDVSDLARAAHAAGADHLIFVGDTEVADHGVSIPLDSIKLSFAAAPSTDSGSGVSLPDIDARLVDVLDRTNGIDAVILQLWEEFQRYFVRDRDGEDLGDGTYTMTVRDAAGIEVRRHRITKADGTTRLRPVDP